MEKLQLAKYARTSASRQRRLGGAPGAVRAAARPRRPSTPAGRSRNAWRIAGRSARALSPIWDASIGTSRQPEELDALRGARIGDRGLGDARAQPASSRSRYAFTIPSALGRQLASRRPRRPTRPKNPRGIGTRIPAPSPDRPSAAIAPAVPHARETGERELDDLPARLARRVRDEADAARVDLGALPVAAATGQGTTVVGLDQGTGSVSLGEPRGAGERSTLRCASPRPGSATGSRLGDGAVASRTSIASAGDVPPIGCVEAGRARRRLVQQRRWTTADPVLAVLGGGQLGRMLGLAGVPLGVSFRFLDPSPERAPARSASSSSARSVTRPRSAASPTGASAVTYEWEGVPATRAGPGRRRRDPGLAAARGARRLAGPPPREAAVRGARASARPPSRRSTTAPGSTRPSPPSACPRC